MPALPAVEAASLRSPDAGPVPDDAPYRDASRPVEERVEDLLGRMTLEEKAGQLYGMGLIGGFLPAIRASRLNIVEALRSM